MDENDDEDEDFDRDDGVASDENFAKSAMSSRQNDEDNHRLVIENDYLAEKLSAMICIQEICKHPIVQFVDHFNDFYLEIKNLSEFADPNVKKESYITWANLIGYFHDYCQTNFNFDKDELNKIASKIVDER